jgi:hypothetical protein
MLIRRENGEESDFGKLFAVTCIYGFLQWNRQKNDNERRKSSGYGEMRLKMVGEWNLFANSGVIKCFDTLNLPRIGKRSGKSPFFSIFPSY